MRLPSLSFLSYESRTENPAAVPLFALFIAVQLGAIFAFVKFVFPWTWEQQLSSGVWAIVLTCLAVNVATCFGEYFFHRYMLHFETVVWLRGLCTSHLAHHKLTSIRFDDVQQRVHSAYAIHDVEHDEHGQFPPWALMPFLLSFTPFFAPMAFSFPRVPVLIGGYGAIAIALFLYETIHVAHHQPYETWWKPKLSSRYFGWLWRRAYGFHQAHHANYKCNMNVAGFFGIPLADLVFGTYKQPPELLVDGAPATKEVGRNLTPQPHWPVSWLDQVALKRKRRISRENRPLQASSR